MREVLVDTNVLVSFLTTRDEKQQRKAADLFRAASERQLRLVLHALAISETVYVLCNLYLIPSREVSSTIRRVLSLPGVVAVGDVPWSVVLDRWPEVFPSLGDATLAVFAKQAGMDAVATFDRDFRKRLTKDGTISYWR